MMQASMNKDHIETRDQFDEQAYIQHYDDIRQALNAGTIESAWWHYEHFGRAEGRKAFRRDARFDEQFYLKSYPYVKAELRAKTAASAQEHYLVRGRGRGFLPHLRAARPDNAATQLSPFGGLWPDETNALDILDGKLEIGQITDAQAALLRHWIRDGYVVLEQAIPAALIDAAERDLDKAFAGGFPDMRFECHKVGAGLIPWKKEILGHAGKAIDIHHFSKACRNVMFADAISEFFGLIFESRAFATQTLGFLRGSGQEGHQDSAYVPFTIPRRFAATWVALEDVTVGAGELFYYPGSHRFPDFLYGGRYKSIAEATRSGYTVERAEVEQHVTSLQHRAREQGIEKKILVAKRGDVLVWHADLVHGGNPVSADITRKSLVTHYCPKRMSPLFSEMTSTDIYEHGGHIFTSHLYPANYFVR
jgi:phytanoyl-CoA hydroxylase